MNLHIDKPFDMKHELASVAPPIINQGSCASILNDLGCSEITVLTGALSTQNLATQILNCKFNQIIEVMANLLLEIITLASFYNQHNVFSNI